MVDVVNKRCKYEDCPRINPSFDLPGGSGQYCKRHKLPDMIDVHNARCAFPGCTKIFPPFGYPNSSRNERYCKQHKLPDMRDVKNKKCNVESCQGRATYGYPGKGVCRCAPHKLPFMIVRPNRRCQTYPCREKAFFGHPGEPIACETHKLDIHMNLVERPCRSCHLTNYLDAQDLCMFCNPHQIAKATMMKQHSLMSFLDQHGWHGSQTDKIVDGGACGKERPDRLFDFGTHIDILECDEH